jgi:hypothetical protein
MLRLYYDRAKARSVGVVKDHRGRTNDFIADEIAFLSDPGNRLSHAPFLYSVTLEVL